MIGPVYEILPDTDLPGNDLKVMSKFTSSECRRMCNDDGGCKAFVTKKNGDCLLKTTGVAETRHNIYSTLYIKGKNGSYWVLWLLIIIIGAMFFISRCRGNLL